MISTNQPPQNIRCGDSYFIWDPDDTRLRKGNNWSPEKIQECYGVGSNRWQSLIAGTKLNDKLVFVGMNPNRNKNKIFQDGIDLRIQVFHSSSDQDLFLRDVFKEVNEQAPTYRGALMTDFFSIGWGVGDKNLQPRDLRKDYRKYWDAIYAEGKKIFRNKFHNGERLLAFGDLVFTWLCETYGFRPRDAQPLKHAIKSISANEAEIYRIDNPSPANPHRDRLFKQLPFLDDYWLRGK